jgi:hypothetical protein
MPSKPFWDLEENIGFATIRANDSMYYRVWNKGSESIKQEVADTLARVRRDFNKLLEYLYSNPELWITQPIAFGIIHTFDIHIPCLQDNMDTMLKTRDINSFINEKCLRMDKLFNIQEMTPNRHGIIGLNKPKIITKISVKSKGKIVDYPIAEKRSMFLTIRSNSKMDQIDDYNKILLLAIHEITHTTCNDTVWKEDNHRRPYPGYHSLMKKWARECGILK